MKGKAVILIILLCSSLIIVSLASKKGTKRPNALLEGFPLPNLTFTTPNGSKIETDSLKGTPMFIHFWASWCTTCDAEMPEIEALFKEKGESLKIIAVAYRDKKQDAIDYMKTGNYSFPFYFDDSATAAKVLGITGVPETYLIDEKGRLFKRIIGPVRWQSKAAQKLLSEINKRG